jgi:hypothetical protein
MSVVIKFREDTPRGSAWAYANWVFTTLAEDVERLFQDDPELIAAMQGAYSIGGLILFRKRKKLALRIVKALRQVAVDTIEGRILAFPGTSPGRQVHRTAYLAALAELVSMIDTELPVLEARSDE